MEVSGVVLSQAPCFSSITADASNSRYLHSFSKSRSFYCPKQQSNWKSSLIVSNDFSDKSHLEYYNYDNGARMAVKEKEIRSNKKEMKKQLKLLKGLSKNLSTFSDMGFGLNVDNGGLDEQVRGQMISEATEVLVGQLQKLKAEKLESKRRKKEEKAKKKAMMTDSSSSSESECERSQVKNIATSIGGLGEATTSSSLIEIVGVEKSMDDCSSNNNNGKIEVCMGGKCKKSGAAMVLENIQKAVGGEAPVVGCKCMGKCRDGPNVKVSGLCMAVGLEDVDSIVNKLFGGNGNIVPTPTPAAL